MTDANTRTRTVTWADPLAALPAATGMSGLEFVNAVVSGKLLAHATSTCMITPR